MDAQFIQKETKMKIKEKRPTMTRKDINSERLRISEAQQNLTLQRRKLDDEMIALHRLCPHQKKTTDKTTCIDCGADLDTGEQ